MVLFAVLSIATGAFGQCTDVKISSKLLKIQHMAGVMDPLSTVLVSTVLTLKLQESTSVLARWVQPFTCLHFCSQKDGFLPEVRNKEKEGEIYKLWKYLGALKPKEERVSSMVTLSVVEGLPQLSAIKTILGKLINSANNLVSSRQQRAEGWKSV